MKILVPVDGSENALATVEWAAETLNKESSEFYLLTVISEPMIAEYKLEDALASLETAKKLLEGKGCKVAASEYLTGDPVQRICQAATDSEVDQVLMGSHGRSGLAKMLMGSVSEGVLESCPVPVFIYRQRKSQKTRSPI